MLTNDQLAQWDRWTVNCKHYGGNVGIAPEPGHCATLTHAIRRREPDNGSMDP
jgi:hypothetical protein